MKKLIVGLVFCVVASSVFAANEVIWNEGTTGLWMTQANWAENTAWYIPGWVSGNPANPGTWLPTDNLGYAIIRGGTAQITSTSGPDGRIQRMFVDGGSSPTVAISGNMTALRLYLASTAGWTGTINQTAGNVAVTSDYFRIGENGTGTYNMSGGTLSATNCMYLGYYWKNATEKGVFNLSDGTVNITADVFVGKSGNGEMTITGGSFTTGAGFVMSTGRSSTVLNKSSLTISGGSFQVAQLFANYSPTDVITVSGSDATKISMSRFQMKAGSTLAINLDENGSTLIEAIGLSTATYKGALLAGTTLQINTLPGFNGTAGSVYDLLWAATTIDITGMNFVNLSGKNLDYSVVDDAVRGGQVLQLTVVPEPATIGLLSIGMMALLRRRK